MSASTRVIVTGAAMGIGLATAGKFTAFGARVCLFDTAADGLKDAGRQVAEAGAEGVLETLGSVTDGKAIAACVAPAYTRTELVGAMIEAGHVDMDSVLKRTPMNRLIEPDDVANVCGFLCSEGASSITGQVLGVDAGWQASGFYSC